MSELENVIRGLECVIGPETYALVEDCIKSGCPYAETDCELAIMKDALDLLRAQEPGWVSVKDRLPENEEMVVCYTPCDGYMFIGFHRTHVSANYNWSAWYIITAMRSTKKITKKVTHWMPLPKPPKEENHETN